MRNPDRERHKSLLRAVVEVSLELAPSLAFGLDNACARGADLVLLMFSLRDVAEDDHVPHNRACRVPDRRSGDLDVHECPVPALANGFVTRVRMPGSDPREPGPDLGFAIRGNIPHWLAEHLRGGPAEDLLCRRVPHVHAVVEPDLDDRDGCTLNRGPQPLLPGPQRFLLTFPLRYVDAADQKQGSLVDAGEG